MHPASVVRGPFLKKRPCKGKTEKCVLGATSEAGADRGDVSGPASPGRKRFIKERRHEGLRLVQEERRLPAVRLRGSPFVLRHWKTIRQF